MRLYHHPMSGNARRVRLAAAELGVPLDLVLVDLTKGEQKAPAYLALNPAGRVPLLEDGDFRLSESNAIMEYLADSTPGQSLLPADRRARADVTRWLYWITAHCQPGASVLNQERLVKGFRGLPSDPVEEARGEALLREAGALLDARLCEHEFLAQDQLTLADVSLAATLANASKLRYPIDDRPHLLAWLGRMTARDSWRATA
jgi:glutathione S-transferase